MGERAGNTSLEEVVMGVRTRQDIFDCDTNIDTTHILTTSRLVSNISGFVVQPNKAIVGANAFAHEAGIHQDGVLKHRETYEIMQAEDVGWNANQLVLGKHSGRNALRSRLSELDISFNKEEDFEKTFARFKTLADKKHQIFDEDLQALATDSETQMDKIIALKSLSINTKNTGEIKAVVKLIIAGKERKATAITSGAVDATFSAIDKLIDIKVYLQLYSVNNVTSGTDSLGVVSVRIEYKNRIVSASGMDMDIVKASAKAYVNAINRILLNNRKSYTQI